VTTVVAGGAAAVRSTAMIRPIVLAFLRREKYIEENCS